MGVGGEIEEVVKGIGGDGDVARGKEKQKGKGQGMKKRK